MSNSASLLFDAAGQIDSLDTEIALLNDSKKVVYDNIRGTIAPDDFKAWKEAVRLRQKRRTKKDEMEAHDERVWRFLSALERVLDQTAQETAVDPVSAPAKAIVEEIAPTRAPAREAIRSQPAHEFPPFDLATGEILDRSDPGPIPDVLKRTRAA